MSAYADGRNSQIISLTSAASNPVHEASDQFSSLPIVNELENYFRQARQLEGKWVQERAEKRKVQQELKNTQTRYETLVHELEAKLKKSEERENQLTTKIDEFHEKEKQFKKLETAYVQEQEYRKKYQEYVKQLKDHYAGVLNQAQLKMQKLSHFIEQLKSKLSIQVQNEKQTKEQVLSLQRQMEVLKESNKQSELDQELNRVKLQHSKQIEDSLRLAMQNFTTSEKSYQYQIEQLKNELAESKRSMEHAKSQSEDIKRKFEEFRQSSDGSKNSIYQYQQALREANQRLRQIYQSTQGWKRKHDELNELIAAERRRYEDLEERMKREKRDKQIALNCLHTAEAKMASLSKIASEARQDAHSQFYDRGLEIGF